MAGVRVHLVWSKDLLDRVDAVRGDLSRGAWVRGLVERELEVARSGGFRRLDLDDPTPVERELNSPSWKRPDASFDSTVLQAASSSLSRAEMFRRAGSPRRPSKRSVS